MWTPVRFGAGLFERRMQLMKAGPLAAFFLALLAGAQDEPAPLQDKTAPMTSQQGQDLLDELRRVRALLERLQIKPSGSPSAPAVQPEAPRVVFRLDSAAQHIGRDNAPLTVVEFTDYQCSYCRQFHQTTFRELRKNYIETGKLRFYTVDFPLEMHPNAPRAAVAAYCASEQGQFWSMRDALIASGKLDSDALGYRPQSIPGHPSF